MQNSLSESNTSHATQTSHPLQNLWEQTHYFRVALATSNHLINQLIHFIITCENTLQQADQARTQTELDTVATQLHTNRGTAQRLLEAIIKEDWISDTQTPDTAKYDLKLSTLSIMHEMHARLLIASLSIALKLARGAMNQNNVHLGLTWRNSAIELYHELNQLITHCQPLLSETQLSQLNFSHCEKTILEYFDYYSAVISHDRTHYTAQDVIHELQAAITFLFACAQRAQRYAVIDPAATAADLRYFNEEKARYEQMQKSYTADNLCISAGMSRLSLFNRQPDNTHPAQTRATMNRPPLQRK